MTRPPGPLGLSAAFFVTVALGGWAFGWPFALLACAVAVTVTVHVRREVVS